MLPQQAINVLQTGFKILFDLDPSLTEHVTRNILAHSFLMVKSGGQALQLLATKCIDTFAPLMEQMRHIHLQHSQG